MKTIAIILLTLAFFANIEACDHKKPPVMKPAKVKYIKKIEGKSYKVCDQTFKCKKCNKIVTIEILRENKKPRNLGTF